MFGLDWTLLNVTLLCVAMLCCYTGYSFIFSRIREESRRSMIPEHLWGISLGGSDITASTISLPYFIVGLIKQHEYLPSWVCIVVGFVDNLYLAASVWTIVMWSIHRLVYLKLPSSTSGLLVARVMIACVWTGSLLLALPPVFFPVPYTFSSYTMTCSANNTTYLLVYGSICIVLPIFVISVVFTKTYYVTASMELKAKRYRPMRGSESDTTAPAERCTVRDWLMKHLLTSTSSCRSTQATTSSESLQAIVRKRYIDSKDKVSQEPVVAKHKEHKTSTKFSERAEIEHNHGQRLRSYDTVDDLNMASIILPFLGHDEEEEEEEESVFPPPPTSPQQRTRTYHIVNMAPAKTRGEGKADSRDGRCLSAKEVKRVKRALLHSSTSSNREPIKSKFLRGRKRTVLILLCLFCSQIMSTLPIYILFIIFHYGGGEFMPTPKMVTLSTTLLVCNTGFNPIIRIAIRPAYNKQFLKWLLSAFTGLRPKNTLHQTNHQVV